MRAKKFEIGILVLVSTFTGGIHAAPAGDAAHQPAARMMVADGAMTPAIVPTAGIAQSTRADNMLFAASIAPVQTANSASVQAAPAETAGSTKDLLALTLIGVMLVAYQLIRKHRLLRQQPFSL